MEFICVISLTIGRAFFGWSVASKVQVWLSSLSDYITWKRAFFNLAANPGKAVSKKAAREVIQMAYEILKSIVEAESRAVEIKQQAARQARQLAD